MPRSGKGEAETLPKGHDDPFAECDEENDQQHAVDEDVELPERPHELFDDREGGARRLILGIMSARVPGADGYAMELDATAALLARPETQQRVKSFLEKRR